jgi:hypothetical protein
VHAKLVKELEPLGRRGLVDFARNAEPAVPAIQRGEKAVGLKVGPFPISSFEKLAQLGVFFHHVSVRVNNRIAHVHKQFSSNSGRTAASLQ